MKTLALASFLAGLALLGARADINLEDTPKPPMDAAKILAQKSPLSQYAIEGMDFVLEYKLYNIGDRAALKVTLDDRHSFPTQSFEIMKGLLQVRWEKIPPGANVTHSVIVRPRYPTVANHTAAQISYYPKEDAKDVRVGYSTAGGGINTGGGEFVVYRLRDYERRYSSKWLAWIVFIVLCLPTTALPFAIWLNHSKKYPASNAVALERPASKKTKKDRSE